VGASQDALLTRDHVLLQKVQTGSTERRLAHREVSNQAEVMTKWFQRRIRTK